MRTHSIALALVILPFAFGCNESNFGSSNGSTANTSASDEEDETPSGPTPSKDCVDGDKVNIAWTGAVKECLIDKGKTYNFESEACTEMRSAEFDCNWDTVKSEMKKLGLGSKVMETDSKNGAKLVSCGQSEDSNRIVVQWVNPPAGKTFDCKAQPSKGSIVTGCYTLYTDKDDMPDKPQTAEEQMKYVFSCMNKL